MEPLGRDRRLGGRLALWCGRLKHHEEQVPVAVASRNVQKAGTSSFKRGMLARQAAHGAVSDLTGECFGGRTERTARRRKRIIGPGCIITSPPDQLLEFNSQPLGEGTIREDNLALLLSAKSAPRSPRASAQGSGQEWADEASCIAVKEGNPRRFHYSCQRVSFAWPAARPELRCPRRAAAIKRARE